MKKTVHSESRLTITGLILLSLLIVTGSCSKPVESPGTNEVFIQGMAFNPSTITVTAGTTITWTNKDSKTHTVTSTTSIFSSGDISPDGTWSHTFSTPGSFPYKCSLHPSMTGTVVVN